MKRCLTGTAVYDSVTVCLDSEDVVRQSVHGNLLLETYYKDAFCDLYSSLYRIRRARVVDNLVDLFIEYDMAQFAATHSAMDRRLARLRKLLRILGSITFDVRTPSGVYSASLAKLFDPVTERIEKVLSILEFYRGKVHRDRDRVHEFLHPVIVSLLNVLKDDWYIVWDCGEFQIVVDLPPNRGPLIWIAKLCGSVEKEFDITEKTLEHIINGGASVEDIVEKKIRRAGKKQGLWTAMPIPWDDLLSSLEAV